MCLQEVIQILTKFPKRKAKFNMQGLHGKSNQLPRISGSKKTNYLAWCKIAYSMAAAQASSVACSKYTISSFASDLVNPNPHFNKTPKQCVYSSLTQNLKPPI